MKRVRKGLLITWPWLIWRERNWDMDSSRMMSGPHRLRVMITTNPGASAYYRILKLGNLQLLAWFCAEKEAYAFVVGST